MITINEQSSIRIEEAKIYYFDPFRIKDEKHDADYIFVTHNHWDHFDKEAIEKIRNENTILIAPENMRQETNDLSCKKLFVLPNNKYSINDIVFETIPSYNTNKQFHPRENNNIGYIIKINDTTYYISGDTDIIDEMNNVEADVWLIPIGGTYTMTYEEAANLINSINPKVCIPTHYGSVVGDISYGNKFKELVKNTKVDILLK